MSEYRTIFGRVAFDPAEREVGGKSILSFKVQVSSVGVTPLIDVTLWEPEVTTVSQGNFVAVTGKYSSKPGQNNDGDPVTYHNLSVNEGGIVVLNGVAAAPKPAAKSKAKAKPADDEDLGF